MRANNYTPGENAEKMMAEASTEKTTAKPLEDAIADFKYKKALDKAGIASHPGLALSFPARSCVTPRAARWFLVYSEQAEAV